MGAHFRPRSFPLAHPGSDRNEARRTTLPAAADAFAASALVRRLLDAAGRPGAAAVNASRPIAGARRASAKAQSRLEDSAKSLEDARDRWAALMRGIALDLGMAPERLAELVELRQRAVSLELLEEALLACREALSRGDQGEIAELEEVVAAVRALARPQPDPSPPQPDGSA